MDAKTRQRLDDVDQVIPLRVMRTTTFRAWWPRRPRPRYSLRMVMGTIALKRE
jgi:glucose-6-phosphate dehydrogenase assembly protein OpcA